MIGTIEERHQGMRAYAEGRHEDAVEAYRRSLAIHEHASTRNNLANALKALGRLDEAALEYRRVLDASPRDAHAWYNLGNLYKNQLKDLRAAAECYRRAIEYAPLMPEPNINLGIVLFQQGDNPGSIALLDRFLELAKPDDPLRKTARDLRTEAQRRSNGAAPR